jgi:hypothetical protein
MAANETVPPPPSNAEIRKARRQGKNLVHGKYTYNFRRREWRLTTAEAKNKPLPAPAPKNTINDNLEQAVNTIDQPVFIEAPISQFDLTQADLKNAYEALSTSELFLFLNNKSIEGYEYNYGMNAGLNEVRKGYQKPNDFGFLDNMIKNAYVSGGQLIIEFYDTIDRMDLVVEFYTQIIDKIDSHDH